LDLRLLETVEGIEGIDGLGGVTDDNEGFSNEV
jgi:hypothetical protein